MWARSAVADFSVIHLDHRHHTFVGAGYENFVRTEKLFQRQVPDFDGKETLGQVQDKSPGNAG